MQHCILMTNLGYARGINGSFAHHVFLSHRHFLCDVATQQKALGALKEIMRKEQADLCCLIEVDTGSFTSAGVNQVALLADDEYRYADAESKYAPESPLRHVPFTAGKSNGFVARRNYPFQKLYFSRGTKRLIYRIALEPGVTLYFTHFSLTRRVRELQLHELFDLADRSEGEVILMGDFNLLGGLDEIHPLLAPRTLTLLNDPNVTTFILHRRELLLDLCVCSSSLASRAALKIIPQPYSDHAALLLSLDVAG